MRPALLVRTSTNFSFQCPYLANPTKKFPFSAAIESKKLPSIAGGNLKNKEAEHPNADTIPVN